MTTNSSTDLASESHEAARHANSPFHQGEHRVHESLGIRDEIEPWARRVVRPFLPEEHRAFYSELPFLVVAARDERGRPWATLLAEEPGFATSPDARTLQIDTLPAAGDALSGGFQLGDDIGLLGIELDTRRRNRVNGRLVARGDDGLALSVDQSFGNCPQYITERRWRRAPRSTRPEVARGSSLSSSQRAFVQRADTFFIATGFRGRGESEAFGMDASHRGGAPGFVRVVDERHLVFPDYAGNQHFNTIGNLLEDPRFGLLFVDFERGDLLQLTGRARIDWDSPEVARFDGAQRLVHLDIEEVVWLGRALPLRFETMSEARQTLRVVEKQQESADVTSFLLAPGDGAELPPFVAGQYLPIELDVPGQTEKVHRTYSLSGAPGDRQYRITVKREAMGLVSRHLHDALAEGESLFAGLPGGEFTLDAASSRPTVLVGAGVGLTPLVSMLHVLARKRERPVWFVHAARDGEHHPLRKEVSDLVEAASNLRQHVAYSRPRDADIEERNHDSVGRVDGALLEKLVPGLDADFYLCGPRGFMGALQSQLEGRGVAPERIHSESFGPVS